MCPPCPQRASEECKHKQMVAEGRRVGNRYSKVSIGFHRACSVVPNPTLTFMLAVAAQRAPLAGAGCSEPGSEGVTRFPASLLFNGVAHLVHVNEYTPVHKL